MNKLKLCTVKRKMELLEDILSQSEKNRWIVKSKLKHIRYELSKLI